MAGKREPLSVSMGDSPGQPRDCELEPACSELLRDPEAVLRDSRRWPDHLCYWTLHRSIEQLTGVPDMWPIRTWAPLIDRGFALRMRPGPYAEWLEISGTGAWDVGVMTFLPDMDFRWGGWATQLTDWRAELVRLANKWWNENIAGKQATGHPWGRGTFSGTDAFLRAVGEHLAVNPMATQLQVATALAKEGTVSPSKSMTSWRRTYGTGNWEATKLSAQELRNKV